ncbi:MAG: EVE domain-containing protein [Planctomycetota bacterium]
MAAKKKTGPRTWLFKSEPDVFSIEDLERAPQQTTTWEGVRNYQARNLLRDEVKVGDRVLFYHSRTEPIGVAGLAEVVREAYPDPFQFEAGHKYEDPKSKPDAPTWLTVDIRFLERFEPVVTLATLKATKGLEQMMVTQRGSRLSIQPVRPAEATIVLELARG